jgi:hypothetical protein
LSFTPALYRFRRQDGEMQMSRSFRLALVISAIWMIAAGNAGMHLAVAQATTAYRSCIESKNSDDAECRRNLHFDWEAASGDRISYAAFAALVPLPLIWLMAYAITNWRREARPRRYDMKVALSNL